MDKHIDIPEGISTQGHSSMDIHKNKFVIKIIREWISFMHIGLKLSMLLWISIRISMYFYEYPCIDLIWILDPGKPHKDLRSKHLIINQNSRKVFRSQSKLFDWDRAAKLLVQKVWLLKQNVTCSNRHLLVIERKHCWYDKNIFSVFEFTSWFTDCHFTTPNHSKKD